ncbi:flagellar assembly protein FliH [Sporolactobacillus spathodeae]
MTSLSNLLKAPRSSQIAMQLKLNAVIDPDLDILNQSMTETEIQRTLDQRIDEAKEQAARILANADQEAKKFRERMENEEQKALVERADAYKKKEKEGYEEGQQAGLQAGKKAFVAKITQADEWIAQAHDAYLKAIEQSKPDLLKLSLAIAEKIIGMKLNDDDEAWKTLVAKAIKEVRDQGTIKISVAPERYVQVSEAKEMLDTLVQDQKIYIFMDSELSENDCLVETAYGKIDVGVDSQLTVIKSKLKEILDGED